jgi:acyl-CoA thioesterase YciA
VTTLLQVLKYSQEYSNLLAAALQPVNMRGKTIPGSQEGSTMTALDDDKPMPRGELTLQIIPLPADTNANGDVFAGWLVKQMDLAAATMAGRISQGRNATVAMDRMEFLSPLRVGSQVGCYCDLVDIGRSSMKISVEVWTLDRTAKHPRKVTEGLFVYVAIDEHGRIREVPEQVL